MNNQEERTPLWPLIIFGLCVIGIIVGLLFRSGAIRNPFSNPLEVKMILAPEDLKAAAKYCKSQPDAYVGLRAAVLGYGVQMPCSDVLKRSSKLK